MKRVFLLLLVLAAVGGGFYYANVNQPREIVLTGIVTTDDVLVSSQIQGRLQKLLVKQGDTVKKGDLLAVIQPDELNADVAYYKHAEEQAATQVAQAQADLEYQQSQSQNLVAQAEANLATSQAQVKEAETDLENLRLTFTREEELYKKGVESIQSYDQARMAYESQKAHVESLKRQIDAAKAAVDLAKSSNNLIAVRQAALQSSAHSLAAAEAQKNKANVHLGYTEIRAPIDGIVDVRAALQGEVVNAGQPIVTLIDPDNLWVRADVEESYIDRIRLGDELTVRLPSDAVHKGKVIYRAADGGYATQRDVSRTKRDIRTFEIRLQWKNTDRALAVGMTAYVTLPLAAADTQSAAATGTRPLNP